MPHHPTDLCTPLASWMGREIRMEGGGVESYFSPKAQTHNPTQQRPRAAMVGGKGGARGVGVRRTRLWSSGQRNAGAPLPRPQRGRWGRGRMGGFLRCAPPPPDPMKWVGGGGRGVRFKPKQRSALLLNGGRWPQPDRKKGSGPTPLSPLRAIALRNQPNPNRN